MNAEFEKTVAEMVEKFEEFQTDHQLFVEKGNKSAGARARKTINELKKLIGPYRKSSVEIAKSMKKTA